MKKSLIYLDTYRLQQDMRIRLPKAVANNIEIKKGITCFDIYLCTDTNSLILKISDKEGVINK